jgi:hypothetical protein
MEEQQANPLSVSQKKTLSESQDLRNPLSQSKESSNLSASKRSRQGEPNSLSNSLKREVASMQRSLELDLPITINLGKDPAPELGTVSLLLHLMIYFSFMWKILLEFNFTDIVAHSPGKCTLCLEEDLILFAIKSCGHKQACWTCLEEYLSVSINEHHLPIACVVVGCDAHIDNADVREIVAPELYAKLERFQQKMESPDLRECPKCQTLNKRVIETSNSIQCGQCEYQYCFLHSDAHPATQSCQEYDNPLNRSKRTEATLAKLKGVNVFHWLRDVLFLVFSFPFFLVRCWLLVYFSSGIGLIC